MWWSGFIWQSGVHWCVLGIGSVCLGYKYAKGYAIYKGVKMCGAC